MPHLREKGTDQLRLAGISFKTQLLYAIVFCTRYVDLFTSFISLYNSIMKIFFISSSLFIVYLIKYKFRATHDPSIDTFKIEFLLGGAAVLGILFPYKYTVLEVRLRSCGSRDWSQRFILTQMCRSCGLSQFGLKLLPSCHNSSCFSAPEKQRRSRRTTCLLWELIVPSIS